MPRMAELSPKIQTMARDFAIAQKAKMSGGAAPAAAPAPGPRPRRTVRLAARRRVGRIIPNPPLRAEYPERRVKETRPTSTPQ